jgi:hypothetical protein
VSFRHDVGTYYPHILAQRPRHAALAPPLDGASSHRQRQHDKKTTACSTSARGYDRPHLLSPLVPRRGLLPAWPRPAFPFARASTQRGYMHPPSPRASSSSRRFQHPSRALRTTLLRSPVLVPHARTPPLLHPSSAVRVHPLCTEAHNEHLVLAMCLLGTRACSFNMRPSQSPCCRVNPRASPSTYV